MEGLEGIRVVEVASGTGPSVAVAWAAKLLADLGADVVKVEPPDGAWIRSRGPWRPGQTGNPDTGGLHLYMDTNKTALTVDLHSAAGAAQLAQLAAGADLVLHSLGAAEAEASGLGLPANPALVTCAVTPFGQTGPYAGWRAEELQVMHGSSWGYLTPGASDRPDLPPIRAAGHQAHIQAGTVAATAALAAVDRAQRTGRGEHVDFSTLCHAASMLEMGFVVWTYCGVDPSRLGTRALYPWKIFEAADGLCFLVCVEQDQWERLVEFMGYPEWAESEAFATPAARSEAADAVNLLVEEWTRTQPVEHLFHEGQKRRIAFAPVFTMADLSRQVQLRQRDFFATIPDGSGGSVEVPGPPARLRERWWQVRRPAPALGSGAAPAWPAPEPANPSGAATRPLDGIRVLDFTWVWAGPFCTLQLAHLGADVIKLESADRLCLGRRLAFHPTDVEPTHNTSGYFNQYSQGKRSLGIDLGHPEAKALVRRLVAECDVVVDNFAVGVMAKLGFSPEDLRAIKDDLVIASISGYGQEGPQKDYMGYGPTTAPLSGLASVTGYEGDGPTEVGVSLGDPAAGVAAAWNIVAALVARRRTGQGQRIDVSLWESTTIGVGEAWLEWALTGVQPEPMGNRDPLMAPNNVYRCAAEPQTDPDAGNWVAIACADDAEWAALAAATGIADERFTTAMGRKGHEDDLDAALGAWTATRTRWDVTRQLQAVRVPAFPSLSPRDLAENPHLEARGFLERLEHPEVGRRLHTGMPWRLTGGPNGVRRAAPALGQDTDAVLTELLGLDAAEIAALIRSHVVT